MKSETFRAASGAALFITTITTIILMWQPAFWVTALPEVAVFCLAAGWLIVSAIGAESLEYNAAFILLTAAALWAAMQWVLGATIYRWGTSAAILYWITGTSITFIGIQIFRDAAIRRRYLRALVILGTLMAVIAPLQLFTSDSKIFWLFTVPYSNVAMGPFVYGNQYAAFIELLLPIALTGVFSDRANWRTLHGLAAVVTYASVLASTSRTGFALTSLEILIVPLLAVKRYDIGWRRLLAPGSIFLGMLVVLCLAVGPDRLIAKLQQKDPYQGRREFSESSLRMIRDRPLLGVGLGNWPVAYPAYATFDDGMFANQAHNDWAQWAAEGGVPFALLIFAVAVWAFPKAIRSGWGFGVAVVFLQCLVDYPIQRMGVAIVFFTLLAAIAYPEELAGTTRGNRPIRE